MALLAARSLASALRKELPDDKRAGRVVDLLTSAVRRARALLSELGQDAALSPDMALDPEPDRAVWQLCTAAPLPSFDAQRLLELDDGTARARLLTTLMDQLADVPLRRWYGN